MSKADQMPERNGERNIEKQDREASPPALGGAPRELGLEEIIQLANKIGLEYVEKRKEAERLELIRTSVRAKIMNRLEQETPKTPESKLKRLAEADAEYLELLEQMAAARAEAEKLRIRYESYRNLFDARRTMISYKKTELKTL